MSSRAESISSRSVATEIRELWKAVDKAVAEGEGGGTTESDTVCYESETEKFNCLEEVHRSGAGFLAECGDGGVNRGVLARDQSMRPLTFLSLPPSSFWGSFFSLLVRLYRPVEVRQ